MSLSLHLKQGRNARRRKPLHLRVDPPYIIYEVSHKEISKAPTGDDDDR